MIDENIPIDQQHIDDDEKEEPKEESWFDEEGDRQDLK